LTERDLVVHLAGFAGALRASGVRVSLSDELDAAVALTLVDLLDREEVRRSLLVSLRIRPGDRARFDNLFDRCWVERASPRHQTAVMVQVVETQHPAPVERVRPMTTAGASGADEASRPGEAEEPNDGAPGYSPDALLRKKPFDECTREELSRMETLLARLSLKLATRRSRRLVPTRGRGAVDLRRSFRRAIGTSGELRWLARRARAIERPSLVVLCDTSGSMDSHARFLLTFMLSLRRAARHIELFAFNTTLTRLTPLLTGGPAKVESADIERDAHGRVSSVLARLAAEVPDWSGGTRLGECLAEFVERYGSLVDSRTTVVIVSDGLDRGDPDILARAMRTIQSRAWKVIWLNPLLGDSRYQPLARGMQAALPFVDRFAPAHNLESLERFITHLEVA
jgi:uncharacterized protein with von Willebrand factor type A (vWA) domain